MYYGEKLNSISHLVGAVFALIGLGALLAVSIPLRDPWIISSFATFGVSLVLLYTMSTLYHSFNPPNLKDLFQLLDHVAIYLLIAGTYTPYMLVSLRDGNGFLILALIWALALAGILSEVFLTGRDGKVWPNGHFPRHGLGRRLRFRQSESCVARDRVVVVDRGRAGLHRGNRVLRSRRDEPTAPCARCLALLRAHRFRLPLHFGDRLRALKRKRFPFVVSRLVDLQAFRREPVAIEESRAVLAAAVAQ